MQTPNKPMSGRMQTFLSALVGAGAILLLIVGSLTSPR